MSFREILGHQRIVGLLARAVDANRLPPSLIFSGPDGVGKRLTALAVAQMFNCTNPPPAGKDAAADACGECSACRRIARGSHPDISVVTPGETGAIKIDQIRDVIDFTIYRPFEGRRRVTIIEDADRLVAPAQNSLLKILEEPPASSVFILVTPRPDALLPTVRSRCSHIRFGRLKTSDVAAVLERDHHYTRRDALAVASASDGSVGQALAAQADAFSEARSDAEGLLTSLRARSDPRSKIDYAKDLLKGGGIATAEREHLGLRLQVLSSLVRDLGLLACGANREHLANPDLAEDLLTLAKSFDRDRALALFDAVDRARDGLERNVGPKVVADWMVLQV